MQIPWFNTLDGYTTDETKAILGIWLAAWTMVSGLYFWLSGHPGRLAEADLELELIHSFLPGGLLAKLSLSRGALLLCGGRFDLVERCLFSRQHVFAKSWRRFRPDLL